MLETIGAVALMLLLFGACIFVHELGHFWLARRRGMVIERFSIGFGKAIWSVTHHGVEYRVGIIPLGGYVMLPQMNPADALEGKRENKEPLPPVSPFSKIIVALAGPAMNIAFAALLAIIISVHGIPSDESPDMLVVTQVLPDSPEYAAGMRPGDKIESIDGYRVYKLEDVTEFLLTSTRTDVPFGVRRDGQLVKLLVHSERDPVLGIRVPKFELGESTYIRFLDSGSPAEQAGLQIGDKIVRVAGQPVLNANHLINVVSAHAGEPVAVEFHRKRVLSKVTVTPFYDAEKKRARIGVGIGFDPLAPKVTVHPSPLDQLRRPVFSVVRTLQALFHPKVTGITPNKLSGAPGIMYLLTQQIKDSVLNGLHWTVFLNVNLAMLNLLPIPVLDGGHILFALVEWLRRRPLNARFVHVVWTSCAAVLISFVLFITLHDVWQLAKMKLLPQGTTEATPQRK